MNGLLCNRKHFSPVTSRRTEGGIWGSGIESARSREIWKAKRVGSGILCCGPFSHILPGLGLARLPAFPPSSPNGRNKMQEVALG